ncbi:MAG: methionyl-tRNA formyltransferase [Chlamydiia bacterium]|nr:methionyl-tRNA formyltransferase [Chlamydiia bacterium]
MNIIYFGTPQIAADVLKMLVDGGVNVLAVVTKPDKPRGRSGKLACSPVKEFALKFLPNIPLYQPEKASTPTFEGEMKKYGADLFVVFAYGEIMKQPLLDIPKEGAINLHASLLPKYRGAAPIQYALLDGAKETGVTVIEMVLKMDAGAILAQEKIPLHPEMNHAALEEALKDLGGETLLRVIKNYAYHKEHKVPQNPDEATYVQKITPQMAEIDWSQSANTIHNQVRAFSPLPGAWTTVEVQGVSKRLKIFYVLPTQERPTYFFFN